MSGWEGGKRLRLGALRGRDVIADLRVRRSRIYDRSSIERSRLGSAVGLAN